MSEELKAKSRRFFEEIWNQGNFDELDELVSPDLVSHTNASPEPIRGPEGIKAFIGGFRAAFPDIRMTVEDQVAEGDTVVNRWTATGTHRGELMGISHTGKQVTVSGITIARYAGGRAVQSWAVADMLGLLQQIGAVPAVGAETRA